ncbi:MAG TPA: PH domain-containing protein [Roseiflexaceae bacterium]|nr:PH domain-containing protein [Roseiflexaceae bacterium]
MPLLEPKIDLELDEGEQILHLARRHWIVLVQRAIIPALIGLAAFALGMFRAVGGRFVVSGVTSGGQFDIVNLLLIGLIVLLVVLWQVWAPPKPKRSWLYSVPYIIGIGALVLALLFRYQGGRLLHIDPYSSGTSDTFTFLLFVTVIVMAAIVAYVVIDWANDFLILTNVRVVYDDQQLLVRHVQQQMLISDIQQVNLIQNTYLQYWLGYGALNIRSFSPRTLFFGNAAHPKVLQDKILAEVNKLRRQTEPELLRQMIEDQIYSDKPLPKPRLAIQVHETHGPLPWLFHPNPEIDYEREQVIWRPFWVFMVLEMLRPIGTFLILALALVFLVRLGLISPGLALAIGFPGLLACAFWAFWVYEEHENDIYILTRQNITDVDKQPFGPESRRVAPLGAIQDISFRVGFWEALLQNLFNMGFGDVLVKTGGAAGGDFTFRHVPDPRGVQATLNDYLTDFRKREKERSLQDALALLKQYHVLQSRHGELMSDERIAALIDEKIAAQLAQPQAVTIQSETTRGAARGELIRALRLRRHGRRRI